LHGLRGGALLMIDNLRVGDTLARDSVGSDAGAEAEAEQDLLAAADRAMYVAKASGGGGAKLAASPG
jgi:GGDEF domain-containing protein